MKRGIRILLAALLLTAFTLSLAGCGKKDPYKDIPNPIATITMSDGKVMRFELQLSAAPNTVANFIQLANSGYYDGQEFYRIAAGALIQSGDRKGDGSGDAGFYIQGEFSENGISNPLKHERGVISMARQSGYDTASSQFFILQGTYPEYDGKYAAFGKALDDETLSTIDAIASTPVDGSYRPIGTYPKISTIRVNTHGYEYEASRIEKKDD